MHYNNKTCQITNLKLQQNFWERDHLLIVGRTFMMPKLSCPDNVHWIEVFHNIYIRDINFNIWSKLMISITP